MSTRLYKSFFYLNHLPKLRWKKLAGFLFIHFLCTINYAQPSIRSMVPLSGPTGTTVTITGTNFDPVASNNIVYFGAVKANIISASATSLSVAVPVGATYEPITVTTNKLTATSTQPFTVTFSCGGNIRPSLFTAPYDVPGGLVYNIRNADMDGDGKTDIIYSDGYSIIVLKNNSSLTTLSFSKVISIAATCCFKFDIADIDGDGKLDLILPNSCNDLVSILKNNSTPGNFSFAPKIDYATGDFPYAVAAVNLDGDGKPDLAVVNMDGNTLSTYKNTSANGIISFTAAISYSTGGQCRDVAIADIDGDSKEDLAVSSQSDQFVFLYRNISSSNSIALATPVNLTTPSGAPEDVVLADFDGDSRPDVVVSNNNAAGNISVFRNLSTAGSFSFSSKKDILTGAYPFRMLSADLNGDGKPDLAIKDQYTSTLTLLENNSTPGTISFASKVDLPTASPNREHLAIGDFNGDGKPDLAVSNNSSDILVFLNNQGLSITATQTIPTCSQYDGAITVNAMGGMAPYQYKIGTLPYQNTGNFTQLPPGSHQIRVKDANGCEDSILIILPSNYLWFNITLTNATCNQNNGSISINGSGTNLPLSYSLNSIDFQSTPQFNNLAPGIYNVYVKDNGGCMNQTGFIISSGCITITPTITSTTCGFGNGSVEVQASGGVAPYQYSLDGIQYTTNNKFTQLTAKDYTVSVKDASGTVVTKTVTVTNIAGPVLSSVLVTGTDCINNTGTATINAQGGTPPFRYVLDAVNFQSVPLFSSLAAGSYKFSVYDANGCFDSRSAIIPVNNNLVINAGNDLTICEGSAVTIAATSNGNSFSWSPATSLNNAAVLSPVASPKTNTAYILTASLGACTARDTVTVSVNPAPVANAGNDATTCPGQSLTLNGSGGIVYTWSPSTYLSDASSAHPVLSGAPKGSYIYSLQVKDNNGCTSLTPSVVKISVVSPVVDAGRDTMVLSGHPVQLKATDPGNYGFVQYSWSPVTGLNNPGIANPVVITDRDIVYTLTAQSSNGCTATDDISVKVYNGVEIYVPTAFTPNNDGHNDILKAIPIGIKEFRYLNIYNRWGQLIFQTKNAARGWDGKLNGVLQTGAFIWMAEGIDYNGNLIRRKGTTVLMP